MAKRRKRTSKNVPAKGRLRDICDSLWALAVKDDWIHKCAVCGSRSNLEAHHLVPRQHETTRYDVRNGCCLCSRCHVFDPNISPHQNAAGFMAWLEQHQPQLAAWYQANRRPPEFTGTKNAAYYIGVIRELRQYVEEYDFERIVGQRFSAWLMEEK